MRPFHEVPFRWIATARQIQSLLAMTQLYKGLLQWRFREIAHTRNAPLLSLERQRHFPRSVGGISLACAVKNKRLSRYDVILNECFLLVFLLRPPKLANLKYARRLQTANQSHQGWRGVTLQRHLNEGTAGQATYHYTSMPEVKRASTRSHVG